MMAVSWTLFVTLGLCVVSEELMITVNSSSMQEMVNATKVEPASRAAAFTEDVEVEEHEEFKGMLSTKHPWWKVELGVTLAISLCCGCCCVKLKRSKSAASEDSEDQLSDRDGTHHPLQRQGSNVEIAARTTTGGPGNYPEFFPMLPVARPTAPISEGRQTQAGRITSPGTNLSDQDLPPAYDSAGGCPPPPAYSDLFPNR